MHPSNRDAPPCSLTFVAVCLESQGATAPRSIRASDVRHCTHFSRDVASHCAAFGELTRRFGGAKRSSNDEGRVPAIPFDREGPTRAQKERRKAVERARLGLRSALLTTCFVQSFATKAAAEAAGDVQVREKDACTSEERARCERVRRLTS